MTSNTEPQVITSPLFSSRGSWPEAEMSKFVIGVEAGAREPVAPASSQASRELVRKSLMVSLFSDIF